MKFAVACFSPPRGTGAAPVPFTTRFLCGKGRQRMFRSLFLFAAAAALCFSGAVRADDKGQFTSDQHFVNDAAIGGMAEVQLGKLAMDKGTSDAVKSLGQRLMRDHQQLNMQLQQLAGKSRLQVPAALD